jgi:hypothetical protein
MLLFACVDRNNTKAGEMKLFKCQSCGQLLYFENRTCENAQIRPNNIVPRAATTGWFRILSKRTIFPLGKSLKSPSIDFSTR